jgi:hypothetical protein
VTNHDAVKTGADKIIWLMGDNADLSALDMQSDIGASLQFARDLRQSLFDVSREVDITSITDKLGALTNFGLRVLYSDSLAKNNLKRDLLGEALLELNRRLLVLIGQEGEASRPGTIAWKDPLPINVQEDMQTDQLALDMKIVDPQTVYDRYAARYGQEWTEVQNRLSAIEQTKNNDNLGAFLLAQKNFNQG